MPANVRNAPTMNESFSVSPRSGTNPSQEKSTCEGLPFPTNSIASRNRNRIGMIRPKSVQMMATKPLVFMPKRLVIVSAQKSTLIEMKMKS